MTMLLSNFHLSTDPSFIKSVTGVDPYHEFSGNKDVASEIFDISLDNFKIRSSVFSEYVVKEFLHAEELVDCVVEATLAAALRKKERRYRVLMGNLMQYANLINMLRRNREAVRTIIRIYERLRFDQRVNDEPLFWLQYAIAKAEEGNVQAAYEFIGSAYERAKDRRGFQTYQIDTQALKILLMLESAESSEGPVKNFDEISHKLELMNDMLNEESHRAFVIKVLEDVEKFVVMRISAFGRAEKNVLTYRIGRLCEALERLNPDYRARTGSDSVRDSLLRAKRRLLV